MGERQILTSTIFCKTPLHLPNVAPGIDSCETWPAKKKSETKDICWKNFFWIFQKMKLVSYWSSGLLFELLSLCTQLQYIYLYCTAVKSGMNEMRKYMVKLISTEICLKSWEFKDVKRDIPMCQSHSTRPHNAKQALYVIIHSWKCNIQVHKS